MTENLNKKVYAATIDLAHQGGGRSIDSVVYVFAEDIQAAMKVIRCRVRGFKKNKYSIRRMEREEAKDLLIRIMNKSRIDIDTVLRNGFMYSKEINNS